MPISAECLQLVMNIINVFILPPLAPPICCFVCPWSSKCCDMQVLCLGSVRFHSA